MKVEQESFHNHFADDVHSVEDEWEVRLTDQSDNTDDLRKRIFLETRTWHFSAKLFLMIEKWLFFNNSNVYFTSIFILTHNIYANI